MLPERLLIGQPIRSLQTMLREISFVYTDLPRLIPDGVFEEETRRAVVSFQQLFNLPATGTVDNDTWDAVVVVYRHIQARPLRRLPRQHLYRGARRFHHPHVRHPVHV